MRGGRVVKVALLKLPEQDSLKFLLSVRPPPVAAAPLPLGSAVIRARYGRQRQCSEHAARPMQRPLFPFRRCHRNPL